MIDVSPGSYPESPRPQSEDELQDLIRVSEEEGWSKEKLVKEMLNRGFISGANADPTSEQPDNSSHRQVSRELNHNPQVIKRSTPPVESAPIPAQHSRRGLIGAGLAVLGLGAVWGVAKYIEGENSSAAASDNPKPPADSTDVDPTTLPSSVETTPAAAKLPFNPEQVAIMRGETAAVFYENENYGPMSRIQYPLSEYYSEVNERSVYGNKLTQELPNGYGVLSDYNPFKEISLTAESDPQDVLYAHLYGWLFAVLHEDPEEGKKNLAAVVEDPNSEAYRDLAVQAEKLAGFDKSLEKTILSSNYQENKSLTRRKVVNGKTQLNIITQGGAKFVFTFKPVPGLAEANQNDDDDGQEVGIWPVNSFGLAK